MKNPLFVRSSFTRSQSGFTLMEMLLVLTIIALLVALAMYNLGDVQGMAERQKVKADILSFKELFAAYQLESETLPTTEQGIKVLWEKPTIEPIPSHWRPMLSQPTLDPWGHSYQYHNPGKHNPTRYDVWSMGPDGLSDTDDDIGNWADTPAKP